MRRCQGKIKSKARKGSTAGTWTKECPALFCSASRGSWRRRLHLFATLAHLSQLTLWLVDCLSASVRRFSRRRPFLFRRRRFWRKLSERLWRRSGRPASAPAATDRHLSVGPRQLVSADQNQPKGPENKSDHFDDGVIERQWSFKPILNLLSQAAKKNTGLSYSRPFLQIPIATATNVIQWGLFRTYVCMFCVQNIPVSIEICKTGLYLLENYFYIIG